MKGHTVSNVRRQTIVWSLIRALTAAVIVAALLCMGYSSNPIGGNMRYRSLDYDMTVQPNGDLRVVQHLDLSLSKHPDGENGKTFWHHFYQRYQLDSQQLSAITDVSVKNVSAGEQYREGNAPNRADLEYSSEDEWNNEFARTWYAENTSCGPEVSYKPTSQEGNSSEASQGKANKDGDVKDKENYGEPSKSQVRSVDDDDYEDSCTNGGGQSGDTIEIGWNIPAIDTAKSMKFDIAMTFKDVVTLYNDVAYFKWEPVGKNNTVPIDNLHARVSLPKGKSRSSSASSVRLPRQWLHYAGKGYVKALNNHILDFTAQNVRPHQYVDLVSISDAAAMKTVTHRKSGNHARSVVAQEKVERVNAAFAQVAQIAWLLVTLLVLLAIIIYTIRRIVVNDRRASYHGEIEYYRDIPAVSPVAGARLLQTVDGLPDARLIGQLIVKNEKKLVSQQMAAALLSLSNKKLIAIYPGEARWYAGLDLSRANSWQIAERFRFYNSSSGTSASNKATISTIVVMPYAYQHAGNVEVIDRWPQDGRNTNGPMLLTQSEKALFDLLMAFAQYNGSPVFDFEQLRDRSKDWVEGSNLYRSLKTALSNEFDSFALVDKVKGTWKVVVAILAVALFVFLYLRHLWTVGFPAVAIAVAAVLVFIGVAILQLLPTETLTGNGYQAAGEILGLRKYMEDFSDFSERGPQDLALWGQYLIYATALGISGPLVRKMALIQPYLADPRWLDENAAGSVLYTACCSCAWSGVSPADPLFDSISGFGDIGDQLSSGFSLLGGSSGDSGDSGSFGGSDGGAGGGDFGGW